MSKPLKSSAKAKPDDLFAATGPKSRTAPGKPASRGSGAEADYTARDIEVLEGLEPVRRRPGMYIGGTDEKALHHLFAEVIDNSMDEALAGHASFIEVNWRRRVLDRDPQRPRHPGRSASKVSQKIGPRSDHVHPACGWQVRFQGIRNLRRPARRRRVGGQRAVVAAGSRGRARPETLSAWRSSAAIPRASSKTSARSTTAAAPRVRFKPDPRHLWRQGDLQAAAPVQDGALKGLSVRRRRDPLALRSLAAEGHRGCAGKDSFHFPGGLKDYLAGRSAHPDIFSGKSGRTGGHGGCEWAVAWTADADGFLSSYCNTIPTQDGGTHRNPACAARCCGA